MDPIFDIPPNRKRSSSLRLCLLLGLTILLFIVASTSFPEIVLVVQELTLA
jgi:hypothetical protein